MGNGDEQTPCFRAPLDGEVWVAEAVSLADAPSVRKVFERVDGVRVLGSVGVCTVVLGHLPVRFCLC